VNVALEKTLLRIGVMPLADAAPLVVAQAHGFFARHGLEVDLSHERAWAGLRDKLAVGRLDAAQMPAPMPLASTLGLDPLSVPMLTALTLNLNGNSIVLSKKLFARLQDHLTGVNDALAAARAFAAMVREDLDGGRAAPVFAHVHLFSTHHYELRYWLAAGGLHPDRDVNLVVVPPPQMLEQLESGRIDGFCVGAPWGELAQHRGSGRIVASKRQIWNNATEKVLAVTEDWARFHPQTHRALLRALLEAGDWLEAPEHRMEAARLMVETGLLDGVPVELLARSLAPMRFAAGAAPFPWRSQAVWYLAQMRRWGHVADSVDLSAVAARVFRPDLLRSAAAGLEVNLPLVDDKCEGGHDAAWQIDGRLGALSMGADRFLDGALFDPATSSAAAGSMKTSG
jgi:ABC-type nitrate/sulfonate/bicarbonate transport systems, periplasmic components